MIKDRILIVEDEDWMAEELNEVLVNHGFEVIATADSYEKALLILREKQPDLVLLDIRLNGVGTGLDIAREINDHWQIPFVFLSSHIDPKSMREILEELPHSILSKPCKPADLVAAVHLALNKDKVQIDSGPNEKSSDSFFVKSEHSYQKIEVDKLLFIKGEGSYIKLQLENERLVLRATIKDFEFLEDHNDFLRVHRSYIVNLGKIDAIHSKYIDIQTFEVPMSKPGREEILKRINTVR